MRLPLIFQVLFVLFCQTYCFGQEGFKTIKLGDNIFLLAKVDSFHVTGHRFDTCKSTIGVKYLCKIDGQNWLGGDMNLTPPRNKLTSLSISLDSKVYPLEVAGMYNPNSSNTLFADQFTLRKISGGYELTGFFADGASTYKVQWIITPAGSRRSLFDRFGE